MNRRLILPAFLILAACSEPEAPVAEVEAVSMKSVSGNVVFRERIGLTPEARLEVSLLDVSLADVAATEIGRVDIDSPGQAPLPFTIEYDPADIQDGRSYSVQAKVFDRGQLIFISDTTNPVLTRGAGDTVDVNVVRASQDKRQRPDVSIGDTRWALKTVYGQDVVPGKDMGEPFLLLSRMNTNVSGFAGCNQFTGNYALDGTAISIANVAVTMMACVNGAEVESAFLKALGEIDDVRVNGETLSAYGGGTLIATFEARTINREENKYSSDPLRVPGQNQ